MMGDRVRDADNAFGGDWTQEKLGILELYLDAYTTALKNKPFHLVYVDAFAGTGRIMRDSGPGYETDEGDSRSFIMGSAGEPTITRHMCYSV